MENWKTIFLHTISHLWQGVFIGASIEVRPYSGDEFSPLSLLFECKIDRSLQINVFHGVSSLDEFLVEAVEGAPEGKT